MEVGFQSGDTAMNVIQVKCSEEFPSQAVLQNITQKTEARLTQQCITQQQELLKEQDSPHVVWGEKSGPWEDTKAFLASFEQVAQACQWPTEEWVARLLPALSGEAQQAFCSLEARDREDYGKLKVAILHAEASRVETLRQHFRQFHSREVEDPRRIYSHLQQLCCQWLRPERHSKEQILDLLILEQFLAILPPDLQNWIRAREPNTCSQAVALVEDFLRIYQESEIRSCQAPLDLKEETMSLGEAEEAVLGDTPRPIYWEVKEESCGNTDSFGGLLVPKPEVFSELGQEEVQYIQVCEDGVTFPGSIAADDRILSENKNENFPQRRSEIRELPKVPPGSSPSSCSLRPEAYETRTSSAPLKRSHQGKEREEPTGTDETTAKQIAACPKEKKHRCPECGHKTAFSSDLMRHMRIHAGDGSYQCFKCRKTFKHRSALNGHQRIHVSKPDPCSKRQALRCDSLGEHQRILQDDQESNKHGKKMPQKESNELEEVESTLAKIFQNMIPGAGMIPEQECELRGHQEKTSKNLIDSIKLVEANSPAEEDTRSVWVKKLLYRQGHKSCAREPGLIIQESPHSGETL